MWYLNLMSVDTKSSLGRINVPRGKEIRTLKNGGIVLLSELFNEDPTLN